MELALDLACWRYATQKDAAVASQATVWACIKASAPSSEYVAHTHDAGRPTHQCATKRIHVPRAPFPLTAKNCPYRPESVFKSSVGAR